MSTSLIARYAFGAAVGALSIVSRSASINSPQLWLIASVTAAPKPEIKILRSIFAISTPTPSRRLQPGGYCRPGSACGKQIRRETGPASAADPTDSIARSIDKIDSESQLFAAAIRYKSIRVKLPAEATQHV